MATNLHDDVDALVLGVSDLLDELDNIAVLEGLEDSPRQVRC